MSPKLQIVEVAAVDRDGNVYRTWNPVSTEFAIDLSRMWRDCSLVVLTPEKLTVSPPLDKKPETTKQRCGVARAKKQLLQW